MRKYLRQLAREAMQAQELAHINKATVDPNGYPTGPSFFAQHWRDYADAEPGINYKRKKARRVHHVKYGTTGAV